MKYLTFFLLLIASYTFSQQNQPEIGIEYDLESEIPKDTTATRGELANGLKYFIKENDRPKKTVYIRLIVKAGHLKEDDKQLGLAHLVEHMGFNGTKNFKKNKLIKYLESIGMKFGTDLNASTGQYTTIYKLKVPSKDLKKVSKAFQVIEDWAHLMLLEEDAINAERPIIIEEFRKRLGSGNRISKELVNFLYPDMPHTRYFGDAKLENIKNFKTEDLRRYYKDWYRPNLMGVIVAGDIDSEFAENEIKKHFSKLENPVNEKSLVVRDSVSYHKETRVKIITDPENTRTGISLEFIDKRPIKEKRTLKKHQKNSIVRRMMLTMINRRLTELSNSNIPPFIGAGVGIRNTISPNHYKFSIGASSSEDGVHTALKQMVLELERVKRFGFTQEELDSVKKDLLASNESFLESVDDWYSNSYLRLLQQEFLNDWVLYDKNWKYNFNKAIIPQINLEDVKKQFLKYYHKDNRVIILTAPEKEDLVLPTEKELLNIVKESELDTEITAYVPKELGNQLIENLRPKGSIVLEEDNIYNIKKLELSNGVKVYYKKTDFDKEQVKFKSFSYGGRSLLSDEENKSIAPFMSIVKSIGVGGYKRYELSKFLTGKKVKVSSFVSSYDEGLKGSARTRDLETMFKLIYLNHTNITKDKEAYLNIVNKIKRNILKMKRTIFP